MLVNEAHMKRCFHPHEVSSFLQEVPGISHLVAQITVIVLPALTLATQQSVSAREPELSLPIIRIIPFLYSKLREVSHFTKINSKLLLKGFTRSGPCPSLNPSPTTLFFAHSFPDTLGPAPFLEHTTQTLS